MAKKFLKGAINPAHRGWCTPLSNPHCTGHRRALALRLKKGGDLYAGKRRKSAKKKDDFPKKDKYGYY